MYHTIFISPSNYRKPPNTHNIIPKLHQKVQDTYIEAGYFYAQYY